LLAETSIFLACAIAGATLDIGKPTENGKVVELIYEKAAGGVSHPKPFQVAVTGRSEGAVKLLQSA
jgi:hypothetical protein